MSLCPCGSGRPYEECCETYIEGRETAPTAEALMRSRYAAHTLGKYDYLNETVHPSIRDEADHEDMKKWSEAVEWEGLEIFSTKDGAETDETGEVSLKHAILSTVCPSPCVRTLSSAVKTAAGTTWTAMSTARTRTAAKRPKSDVTSLAPAAAARSTRNVAANRPNRQRMI